MNMFDLSRESANTVHALAGMALVLGALLVLIGTVGSIWSGGIRERYVKETISKNSAEAETAKMNAALASERAAELSKQAEEARLEQEQLKARMAWRRITSEQHDRLVTELSNLNIGPVWLTFIGTDPEANLYRADLAKVFEHAGIEAKYFSGYTMAVGLQVLGPSGEAKDSIIQILRSAGLHVFRGDEKSLSNSELLEILVGSKPPQFER